MIKHFAKRLLLPVSVALAVASCQQPSATTTSSSSVSASPTTSASAKASESPKTSDASKADKDKSDAPSSPKTKDVDAFVKENAEYKEFYEATGGIKYVGLVETETCKALDQGVPLATLIDALEKEFDKQGSSVPADKLTKLKEYTGFVLGSSIAIACPQHKDKLKS
jgi:hypothetical protein